MRFLHSADLHIDRSFEGVHLLSEKVKTQLPAINQKIIRNLVDVALEKSGRFCFAGWGYIPSSTAESKSAA